MEFSLRVGVQLRGRRGLAVAGAGAVSAQDLASFEAPHGAHAAQRVDVHHPRAPGAPVFSFATQVDVGAAQDPKGMTGLAHMSEHMAFKGTRVIGTTDWAKGRSGAREDGRRLHGLGEGQGRARSPTRPRSIGCSKAFEETQADAQQYVEPTSSTSWSAARAASA